MLCLLAYDGFIEILGIIDARDFKTVTDTGVSVRLGSLYTIRLCDIRLGV